MTETTTHLLARLRKILASREIAGMSDADLAERFRVCRDEACFAALVERHGGMVLGVCRRVLADGHDAEDAWQATFLVLSRRVGAIRKPEALASWLHGVAFRIASDLRRRKSRARTHPLHDQPAQDDPAGDPSWREIRTALDEELANLPERWRLPILLCHLEGKTRDEAAQMLGWSVGAVRGCLERGRAMLAARLKKRGIALSAALSASLLAEQTVSAALAVATAQLAVPIAQGAAIGSVVSNSQTLHLVQGAIRAMLYTKLQWLACVAAGFLLAALVCGVPAIWLQSSKVAASTPESYAEPMVVAVPKGKDAPKRATLMRKETKQAIDDGLALLARQQGADGAWTFRDQSNVGITSLAGLAFLSAGHSPDKGKYAGNVRSALAFVRGNVDQAGFITTRNDGDTSMYSHGFATLFLAEAHRATGDKKRRQELKAFLEKAVQLIVQAQNAQGGWRYTPRPADGDLTVTVCQLRALLAAKRTGIAVPKNTLDAGFAFLALCQSADGGFAYVPRTGPASYGRTMAALSALADADMGKHNVTKSAIAYVRNGKARDMDAHYWYERFHENRAMQVAGDAKKRWYADLQDEILNRRANGQWTDRTYGVSYGTAMAILALTEPAARP